MRTPLPLALIAACCTVVTVASAQTPGERELNQLIEQRDKALAAATAPIHARFKTAAEQLLRRATQSGDLATANKIQAALGEPIDTGDGLKDLRKQLAGTTWKVAPGAAMRPGFADTLTFTPKTVEPGGYLYAADKHNEVTINFRGGDKQVLTLTKGGKRLEFTFRGAEYAYELAR